MRYFFILFSSLFTQLLFARQADIILYNGKIFTADSQHLYVEALAVTGNTITAVGSNASIQQLAGPATERINLQGKTVIPGINDAHYHDSPPFTGRMIGYPQDGREPNWQEIKDSIAAAVSTTPRGTFISGTIGTDAGADTTITRATLDQLAPNHPLVLSSFWGHVSILNSAALKALQIADDATDPKGGFYGRDQQGKINGRLYEITQLYGMGNPLTNDSLITTSLMALRGAALYLGVTSIQNMCTGASPEKYASLISQLDFPLRFRLIRWARMENDGRINIPPATTGNSDGRLHRINGTKWLLDGTPIERLAQVKEGYKDQPGWKGRMNFSATETGQLIREADKRDDPLMVHAVGDETIDIFLEELNNIPVKGKSLQRPRIEHGDGLLPARYEIAKRNKVVVVQNPTHFTLVEMMHRRWQGEAEKHSMPMRSLLEKGIPLALGSDGPINPYLNIMFACLHPFRPEEALTREQAVMAYTITSAYAEFAESYKGSLTKGKLADLAVLSQDIFTIPLQQLPGTHSVLTMIDGKVVYKE